MSCTKPLPSITFTDTFNNVVTGSYSDSLTYVTFSENCDPGCVPASRNVDKRNRDMTYKESAIRLPCPDSDLWQTYLSTTEEEDCCVVGGSATSTATQDNELVCAGYWQFVEHIESESYVYDVAVVCPAPAKCPDHFDSICHYECSNDKSWTEPPECPGPRDIDTANNLILHSIRDFDGKLIYGTAHAMYPIFWTDRKSTYDTDGGAQIKITKEFGQQEFAHITHKNGSNIEWVRTYDRGSNYTMQIDMGLGTQATLLITQSGQILHYKVNGTDIQCTVTNFDGSFVATPVTCITGVTDAKIDVSYTWVSAQTMLVVLTYVKSGHAYTAYSKDGVTF